MRWRPVADGALRARVEPALRRIAELLREPDRRASPTLALGDAGTALLFAYLGRAKVPVRGARGVARQYAERAARAVAATAMPMGLMTGVTGIAWMMQHLRGAELPARDACAELDEALRGVVGKGLLDREFDLVTGLAGIGAYALDRGDRALLAAVVERLAGRSAGGGDAAVWIRPESELVDTGVAHGVAGIAAVLGQASEAGIPGARALYRRAARWLRAQARWREPSVFPAMAKRDGERAGECRLAWCYGDIGIACALSTVGEVAGQTGLRAEAVRLARRAAERSFESAGVVDPGLCHGAAGVALGFQRMFAASGDESLREAARRWYARTLDEGLPDAMLGAEAELGRGLLGAAGIGLAYLAATTAVMPRWCGAMAMLPLGARRSWR